jgi:hypothetical protein
VKVSPSRTGIRVRQCVGIDSGARPATERNYQLTIVADAVTDTDLGALDEVDATMRVAESEIRRRDSMTESERAQ